ncbi:MAG TPA: cation diffusion facilitator family transporter [Gaiellaceae bacterium]|nr:cation diffusion facilitator family transporter [Gaiellaceae bacterium]
MQGERRTVLIALAANGVIAVAKGIGGVLTGSSAMLAETAHSIADTVDQVLLLVSLRLGERQPDEEHPFGYGKDRFFWTFLVAVVIFLAGAIFSIGDGVTRLLGKDLLGSGGGGRVWINFLVLGIAFVSESTSLARAWRQTRRAAREAGYGLVEYVRVSKEPTTKMVLSEDLVAVTGVVVAFVGVLLQEITGDQRWDASAAVLIGLLLVYVAFALGRDIRGLLIGEAARPDQREALRRTLVEADEVDDVVELLTMYVGPKSLLVAARIDLAEGIESSRVEELSNELDRRLRDADGDVDQVFLDATPRATRSG